MLYIFTERLPEDLREKSLKLRSELPDILREVEQHPAEVAESRVDAILALIGLIQKFNCNLAVFREDGTCVTNDFF